MQEAKTAMQMWIPQWWSSELNHFQEFPEEPLDPKAPFHGQDYEDQYAADFLFWNQKHGIYLEMGGYDGITFTNTLHFRNGLGWRGILLEASPLQVVSAFGCFLW